MNGTTHLAVNDVSFHRRANNRVAELAYSVEGDELGEVRCDGLVASTPVGSTGYNLANSGPVLAWGVEGYVVSFIAPHTLTARTLVVATNAVLSVQNRSENEPVDVMIDGRILCCARAGCRDADPLRARQGPAGAEARLELLPPAAGEVRQAGVLSARVNSSGARVTSSRQNAGHGPAPSDLAARQGTCSLSCEWRTFC